VLAVEVGDSVAIVKESVSLDGSDDDSFRCDECCRMGVAGVDAGATEEWSIEAASTQTQGLAAVGCYRVDAEQQSTKISAIDGAAEGRRKSYVDARAAGTGADGDDNTMQRRCADLTRSSRGIRCRCV